MTVINTATNIVSDTISVAEDLLGICVSADGSKVYVTNSFNNSVNVINAAMDTVSDTIAVGNNPYGISVSPDGSKIYVVNSNDNTVSVINTATNTVTDTIKVGNAPVALGNFISSYTQPAGIASYSLDAASISIYPNPATNELTIHASGFKNEGVMVEVVDLMGQITSSPCPSPPGEGGCYD